VPPRDAEDAAWAAHLLEERDQTSA
jgi:hypothetical protein